MFRPATRPTSILRSPPPAALSRPGRGRASRRPPASVSYGRSATFSSAMPMSLRNSRRSTMASRSSMRAATMSAARSKCSATWRADVPKTASDREADAAAAGRHGVRVLDLERLAHQIVDEIDFRTLHIFERDRIDEDHGAVAFDHKVVRGARLLDIESVLETRAAAALDRNAQRRAFIGVQ